jgi:hypothetical protein
MRGSLEIAVEDFKRRMLAELLEKCTPEQCEMFHKRLYPEGVAAKDLETAYYLAERTIRKNEKRSAEVASSTEGVDF